MILLQYPVFMGAFPFSQDLEFDLKQFQCFTKKNMNELQVTGLLREFTKNCGEEAIQELNTQKRPLAKSGKTSVVTEMLGPRTLGSWEVQYGWCYVGVFVALVRFGKGV